METVWARPFFCLARQGGGFTQGSSGQEGNEVVDPPPQVGSKMLKAEPYALNLGHLEEVAAGYDWIPSS